MKQSGHEIMLMFNYRKKLRKRLIKGTARRNINNLRYADDTTLMADSEEELKSLLIKVKEESEKRLKLNIQKLRSWHPVSSLHGK